MKTFNEGDLLGCQWEYKNLLTDQVEIDADMTVPTSVSLDSDKVSVNVGKFIPNIYRINPYKIYRESSVKSQQYWFDEAIDSGAYQSKTSLRGDVGAFLAYRAKNVVLGIDSGVTNLPDRALQKAYGKLGAGDVSLGETLGELRETLELLRHPFKGFRDFLYSANLKNLGLYQRLGHYSETGKWVERGGRALSGAEAAKVAANTWLEFRYGFMPFVYTVQDIIKLANAAMKKLDAERIRSVRAKVQLQTPVEFISDSYGDQLGYTELRCNLTGTDDITCRSVVNYRMTGLPTLADLLQLSPQFWPETAWELTRLSFAVDWWLDVGSWLGSFRYTPSIQVLGNTVSTKIERLVKTNIRTNCAWIPNAPQTSRGIVNSYTVKFYERVINQSLPILPQFRPEFRSYLHTVDALALILQPVLTGLQKRR